MKDTILLMKRRYTTQSFIDFIEPWIRASGFPFTHDQSDNIRYFIRINCFLHFSTNAIIIIISLDHAVAVNR